MFSRRLSVASRTQSFAVFGGAARWRSSRHGGGQPPRGPPGGGQPPPLRGGALRHGDGIDPRLQRAARQQRAGVEHMQRHQRGGRGAPAEPEEEVEAEPPAKPGKPENSMRMARAPVLVDVLTFHPARGISRFGATEVRLNGRTLCLITVGHAFAGPMWWRRYPHRRGEMAVLYGLHMPELPPHYPQKAYIHTGFFHGGTDLALIIHEGDRIEDVLRTLHNGCRGLIPAERFAPDSSALIGGDELNVIDAEHGGVRGSAVYHSDRDPLNPGQLRVQDVGYAGLSGSSAFAANDFVGIYCARLPSNNDKTRTAKVNQVTVWMQGLFEFPKVKFTYAELLRRQFAPSANWTMAKTQAGLILPPPTIFQRRKENFPQRIQALLRSRIPTREPIAAPTQPPNPPPVKGPPPAEDHVATEIWILTQALAAMAKRLDGGDEKISAIAKRCDGIDRKIAAMNKRFIERVVESDEQLEDLRGQLHDQTRRRSAVQALHYRNTTPFADPNAWQYVGGPRLVMMNRVKRIHAFDAANIDVGMMM